MNFNEINAPLTTDVQPGHILLYSEQIFVKNHNKSTLAGERICAVEVLKQSISNAFFVKIIKSKGFNAFPENSVISKPVSNLLRSFRINDHLDKLNFKSGGHLEGVDESGKKIKMDDASRGGMGIGSSHADGGIKGEVGTEKRPIEFEGNEIILTKKVSDDNTLYEFEGKQMTARQIASKLNVDNGGVAFAEGGEVPEKIKCSGKRYNFGGNAMSDSEIANSLCGCDH